MLTEWSLKSDNTELTRALKDMPNDKAHLKVISVSENNRSTMNEKDLSAIVSISEKILMLVMLISQMEQVLRLSYF